MSADMVLRIGGVDYTVVEDREVMDAASANGRIDFERARIVVRPGVAPQYRLTTLVHEIMHVLFRDSRMECVVDPAWIESLTDVLARGVLQVLRDNPVIVRQVYDVWPAVRTESTTKNEEMM